MEANSNQEKQAAQTIKNLIQNLRKDKHIVNEVIRDDVFAILRAECIVLFYASKDSGIEGCHMIKPVNGEIKQFVFINTTKVLQEQTWTAAHELGYIRKGAEQKNLEGFEEQSEFYDRLIKENQYTRLEVANEAYAMGSIEQDINLLGKNEVYSDNRVARLREMFHLSGIEVEGGSYNFGE